MKYAIYTHKENSEKTAMIFEIQEEFKTKKELLKRVMEIKKSKNVDGSLKTYENLQMLIDNGTILFHFGKSPKTFHCYKEDNSCVVYAK